MDPNEITRYRQFVGEQLREALQRYMRLRKLKEEMDRLSEEIQHDS